MLDFNDARTISPAAIALAQAITEALSPDGDGGKRITRAEGRKVLGKLGDLLVVLIRDLLD